MKNPFLMHKLIQFAEKNRTGLIALGILSALAMVLVFAGKSIKSLLQKFGILNTDAQQEAQESEAETTRKVNQEIRQSLETVYKGQALSKPVAEWAQIADIIHNNLKRSALDDNYEDAGYQLARPKNDADIHKLIEVFGSREENYFGVIPAGRKTLPQFVTSNLSREKIAAINDNYRRKGIKYRW
jgi:hypothetical protein